MKSFPGLVCGWLIDLVTELMAKEKDLGIHLDPDLDFFLKVVTLICSLVFEDMQQL
jgi:hypothetical protein